MDTLQVMCRRLQDPNHGSRSLPSVASRLSPAPVRGPLLISFKWASVASRRTVIHSLWLRYLDETTWIRELVLPTRRALEIAYTSCHADQKRLVQLALTISSRTVVPIHTDVPEFMSSFARNVRILRDGGGLDICTPT
jgi:hypothetical protein